MTVIIRIQTQAIETSQIRPLITEDSTAKGTGGQDDAIFGAEVCFTGYVRQHDHDQPISHLEIDHYPDVTEAEIKRIVQIAQAQWQLHHVTVVHRVGRIGVGEPIVWVMTQSKHRTDAYAGNEFIMDYLKVAAPFWKKECFVDGRSQWVPAKQQDQDKYTQWLKQHPQTSLHI